MTIAGQVVEVEAYNVTGPTIQWLVPDQLGTPRIMVDQSGKLGHVTRHDYLPFGEELFAGTGGRSPSLGYGSGDNVRQQLTAKERNVETGLDYFLARHYSATQGRFTSVDPFNYEAIHDLSDPQGWNGYVYVKNNPCTFTDRDGRCICLGQRLRNLWNGFGPYSDEKLRQLEDKWRQYLRDEEKKYGTLIREGTQIINVETISRAEVFKYAAEFREAEANNRIILYSPEQVEEIRQRQLDMPLINGLRFPRVPQTPGKTTVSEFGRNIMKWGTGNADARARAATLTKQELEQAGVTRQIAEAWRDFYKEVLKQTPNNPSAAGRVELMQKAVELLGGK